MESMTAEPSGGFRRLLADGGSRSRLAEHAWIGSVVGYTVLRLVVAWGAFSDHGANVWVFGLIDVGTAGPYAKAVAVVCRRVARAEWRRLAAPVTAAVLLFFAPYAYLWFAAGEMPADLRLGMVICVAVLALAAIAGVLSKARKLRREAVEIDLRVEVSPEHSTATVVETTDTHVSVPFEAEPQDLVIDLTSDQAELSGSPLDP